MHFEKQKALQNGCVPTLPKIFRPVTRNTLFFYLVLSLETNHKCKNDTHAVVIVYNIKTTKTNISGHNMSISKSIHLQLNRQIQSVRGPYA